MKINALEKMPEATPSSGSSASSSSSPPPVVGGNLLSQAAEGLLFALRIRDGDIMKVTKDDTVVGTLLSEAAINYYYPEPIKILREVEEALAFKLLALNSVVSERASEPYAPHIIIRILLESLSEDKTMLHIISLTRNYLFWERELGFLPRVYIKNEEDWPEYREEFVCHGFCFLFMEIIRFWSEKDFATGFLPACTKLLEASLTTSLFSAELEEIFFG